MTRVLLAALVAASVAGCGPGPAVFGPGEEPAFALMTSPSACLTADNLAEPGPGDASFDFPPGLGVRFGFTFYPAATKSRLVPPSGYEKVTVDPRLTVGCYYHFLEKDTSRVEVAFDLTPDIGNFGNNGYSMLTGDYVRFLGGMETFCVKVGGGTFLEINEDRTYFFLLAEAGGGIWVGLGENVSLFASATLQMPLAAAEDVNVPYFLTVHCGIDF